MNLIFVEVQANMVNVLATLPCQIHRCPGPAVWLMKDKEVSTLGNQWVRHAWMYTRAARLFDQKNMLLADTASMSSGCLALEPSRSFKGPGLCCAERTTSKSSCRL